MEKFSFNEYRFAENDVANRLGLVEGVDALYTLENINNVESKERVSLTREVIENSLFESFSDYKVLKSESVVRPLGESTLFTTSGVQRIETLAKNDVPLVSQEKFVTSQPVIRSQFMDKIRQGTSTSFVNYSVESFNTSNETMIEVFKKYIQCIEKLKIDTSKITVEFSNGSEKWGQNRFDNFVTKIFYENIEFADIALIYNYPFSKNKIPIVDLGFGMERLIWMLDRESPFFPEYADYYVNSNKDLVTGVLDPIRSMVLIALDGTGPSNANHGYRLRQFSKRFVDRNLVTKFDENDLINKAYLFWTQFNHDAKNIDLILNTIKLENSRNFNALLLKKLRDDHEIDLNIDINRSSEDFITNLGFSVKKEIIDSLKNYFL